MDILLINPDNKNPHNNIPWGVLAVGSYLTRLAGRRVRLLDASLQGEEYVLEQAALAASQIKLIGISAMTRDTPFLKRVADRIKSVNPQCRVVTGGAHAMLCPESTAEYANIDFVVTGEGEIATQRLLEELESARPDFLNVPGIVFRQAGEIFRTPPAPAADPFDVDYALLDPKVTAGFGKYIQVLSGRGCSFKCTFCFNSVLGQKWRPHSAEMLALHLERIVEEYDPQVVFFRDENFFQDKTRIHDFIRIYKEKGFRFRWRATCRADYFHERFINEALLDELVAVNCQCLKFGFESGSERVQRSIRKRLGIERIKRVVDALAKRESIERVYSFLIGLPGETIEDYQATLKLVGWILEVDPKAQIIGPQYFRIYPGGELYEAIQRDWKFVLPTNFEGWCGLYAGSNTEDGFDTNFVYPWIPAEGQRMARDAAQWVSTYRSSFCRAGQPERPFRDALVQPLKALILWRLRTGNFQLSFEFSLLRRLARLNGQVHAFLARAFFA